MGNQAKHGGVRVMIDLDSYQAQFEDQRDAGALAMLADYRRLLASEWIDGKTLADQARRIRELEAEVERLRQVVDRGQVR